MSETVIMIVLLGISPHTMQHKKVDVVNIEMQKAQQEQKQLQHRVDNQFFLPKK